MHTPRLVLLAAVAIGAAYLLVLESSVVETVPLPATGLSVRLQLQARRSGDYFFEVTMPKVGTALGLTEETVPCDMQVTIERNDVTAASQHIVAIRRTSEIGWSNIQIYRAAPPINLNRGNYAVTITGGACPSAVARGASIRVLKEDVGDPVGLYLIQSLYFYLALIAIFGGVAALTVLEVRGRPKTRA